MIFQWFFVFLLTVFHDEPAEVLERNSIKNIFVWPLGCAGGASLTLYWLICTCRFHFNSYQDWKWVSTLCVLNSLAWLVFMEANHSVSVFVWNPPNTLGDQRRKPQRYTVNFILESNRSVAAEVARSSLCLALPWRPYKLCNASKAWNSIWSAWPPSLDHGWCPSFSPPLRSLSAAWAAAEPWAPINPMMPGCGWYGDQTGHRESCDSQVKGGIDFLIRSSTQIELQLNFNLSPSLVRPHD